MGNLLEINNVVKTYGDFTALNNVSIHIPKGSVFGLLGPNGAGKTTLISTICGLTSITSGKIEVNGFDVIKDYRKTREIIGLVPQELALEPFEKVINSVRFSRRLFGKKDDNKYLDQLLIKLQLFDKKDNIIKSLSGGMKRRVMIAKALSHNPSILFLDEPTAGVSPIVMDELFDHIIKVKRTNVAILMVEQNAKQALNISDRGYVLVTGENKYAGTGKELLNDPRVRSSFLGG